MASVLRTRYCFWRRSATATSGRRHGGSNRPRERLLRTSALLLMAALLALAGRGYAVGLGEIRLDSALNERLRAEIPLIDIRGLDASEIIVSLASNQDFARLGVERFFYLGDLRFEVEVSRSGVGVVRVTSSRPITEPYLNFLVQVLWPQGRLLKEYTLLLDPPTFSQAPAPVVSEAVQAPAEQVSSGVVDRAPVVAPAPAARVELAPTAPVTDGAPAALDAGIVGDEYRMTDRTDTLWSIAQRVRPSRRATIDQTMLAIQRRNPDAFLDNNINRLKAGMTLRLPSEAEVLEISAAEATEQVAAQNRSWRSGIPVAQAAPPAPTEPAAIDATSAAAARQPEPGDAEGRLRIMAGSGDSVTASAAVEPVADETMATGAPPAQLAAALEERDRLSLEVADLTAELDREKTLAAQQLAVKDRQLEVRDQQIAQMQAELARLRELAAAPEQSGRSQDQSASGAAAPWWQAPGMMGAGAGAVVLLLAGGLVAARRRRARAEPLMAGLPPAAGERAPVNPTVAAGAGAGAGAPALAAAAAAAAAPALVVAPASDAAPEPEVETAAAPVAAGPGAEPELAGTELTDVIGEADIYLTYNRFNQAAELLEAALAEEPDRHDVRLKLLEVRERSGDRAAVDRELETLGARGAGPELLAAAAAIAGVGAAVAGGQGAGPQFLEVERDVLPEEALAFEAPAAPVPAADALELDLELFADVDAPDAGEGELEAEFFEAAAVPEALEQIEALAAPEPVPPAAELSELEIELDDLLENAAADLAGTDSGESPRADSGLLGGDLGIDFRLDEDDLEALDDEALALEMDGVPAEPEEGFDFADEGDSASTKLDLARAYSEMGDPEGAREILLEVLKEGTVEQQQAAQELLDRL